MNEHVSETSRPSKAKLRSDESKTEAKGGTTFAETPQLTAVANQVRKEERDRHDAKLRKRMTVTNSLTR